AAWLSGRDYSFSAHAKDVYAQDPAWLREKIARARFVVTCTEYNRQYLQTLAGPGACVLRAYHGIDATRFEPRPAGDGPSRPTTILSVGRLVPKQGFLTLVRALRRLAGVRDREPRSPRPGRDRRPDATPAPARSLPRGRRLHARLRGPGRR